MKLYGYNKLDRFLFVKNRDASSWCDLFSVYTSTFVPYADLSDFAFLILFYFLLINVCLLLLR
jgi:hypothetical protein